MFILSFLLGLNLFANAAPNWDASGEQFYRIHIPATNQSCEKEASLLADRFKQLARINPKSTKCSSTLVYRADNQDYNIYALDLVFDIPKTITNFEIHSTFYGNSGTIFQGQEGNDFYGLYSTFAACLTELAARTQEFKKYSGVEVLSSTCQPAKSDIDVSYVLRIDSVGDPKIKLYSSSAFAEQLGGTDLENSVQNIIIKNGGKIVAQDKGYVYYYSSEYINPHYRSFGFLVHDECVDQISDVTKILSRLEIKQSYVSCIPFKNGRTQKEDLMSVMDQSILYSQITITERYYSYNECKNDKARVLASFKGNEENIYGAICEPDRFSVNSSNYVMEVYRSL